MPSNWLYVDTNFPTFGEETPVEEKVTTIQNYMFMLVEQMRYTLQNLDQSNMNDAAVDSFVKTLTDPIYVKLEDGEKKITQLAMTVDGMSLTASNGSASSTISLTANGVVLSSAVVSFYGMVTFSALATAGMTTINGGNITTGTIEAITLKGNTITGGTITGTTIRSVSSSDNGLEIYYGVVSASTKVGGIRFDDTGTGTEVNARYRMFIYTSTTGGTDWAMKLRSAGGMSLESGNNIYIEAATTLTLTSGGTLRIDRPNIRTADGTIWTFQGDGIYKNGTKVVEG